MRSRRRGGGWCAWLAAALLAGAAAPAVAEAPPWLKGVASLVIPGAGQAANGDYDVAAAHFGVFAVSVYGMVRYEDRDDYLDPDERYDEANDREYINATTLKYDYAARLATDTMLYSGYAAYRDARLRDNAGYSTPAPDESLSDLALAPFSWRYLSRPTTFIPIGLVAAAAFSGSNRYAIYRADDVSEGDLHTFNLVANEMTAIGEEGFFRGFLNNEFSSRYGEGWGLFWSSLVFGLAHTGQGQAANALQATGAGLYLGWLHQRNGYEAGEGAALHFWWNVISGIAAIENGGSAQLVTLQFSF